MQEKSKHIIMLASENDALKGGKVGGVGDVVRDVPGALSRLGRRVTVITPSYGFLHKDNPSKLQKSIRFPFGGRSMEGALWEVEAKVPCAGVVHLVFDHPDIGGNPIYFHDPAEHAFARDATKYAMFCSGVGQILAVLDMPSVLHLHDWHTAFLFLLRELHPDFVALNGIKTVFTIHNLAIQGTRTIKGNYASVESWFPELFRQPGWISHWKDSRYKDPAFTPMAAGIQYADKVHTVSSTYAEEILKPSDHATGYFGGEGLEKFLQRAKDEKRLFGILNGCEYPKTRQTAKMSFHTFCELAKSELSKGHEKQTDLKFDENTRAIERVQVLHPEIVLTSVTRVVDQKVRLLFERGTKGETAIHDILSMLERLNGVYVLFGSGTQDYEDRCLATQGAHKRFLYLRGYSEMIAGALYRMGTIFLMPSLFEPCGISQMLAMRDGQPCIVHAVGGLRDTVMDKVNGFQFSGSTMKEKVDKFVEVTGQAIELYLNDRTSWNRISSAAAKARFTWESSARKYIDLLYTEEKS